MLSLLSVFSLAIVLVSAVYSLAAEGAGWPEFLFVVFVLVTVVAMIYGTSRPRE